MPGHEVVGTVSALGSRAAAGGLLLGQRVGVGWMRSSCRACPACVRGEENICPASVGLITAGGVGGFGDHLRVPASFALPLPASLRSEHAAPLLCAGVTVYAPLMRYLRPGASVAVLGLGGLGHLAVQFASAMGGRVTAVDVFPRRRDCRRLPRPASPPAPAPPPYTLPRAPPQPPGRGGSPRGGAHPPVWRLPGRV